MLDLADHHGFQHQITNRPLGFHDLADQAALLDSTPGGADRTIAVMQLTGLVPLAVVELDHLTVLIDGGDKTRDHGVVHAKAVADLHGVHVHGVAVAMLVEASVATTAADPAAQAGPASRRASRRRRHQRQRRLRQRILAHGHSREFAEQWLAGNDLLNVEHVLSGSVAADLRLSG